MATGEFQIPTGNWDSKLTLPILRRTLAVMAKNSGAESTAKSPSHKVIVALTVQEILDEHIAKKLA
jgi:hypothetical protein